jgi:hypothetical protein
MLNPPNPDKPEPKVKDKTNKDFIWNSGTHKGKKQSSPDFLSSSFLIFLSIFARNSALRDYSCKRRLPQLLAMCAVIGRKVHCVVNLGETGRI